jgi:hypothetical protein
MKLDPLSIRHFQQWQQRFWKAVEQRGVEIAWNHMVEEECIIEEDLEWALYWAVDGINSADEAPETMASFHQARATVLRDLTRLDADLARMMNLRFADSPVWVSYAWVSGADIKREIILFNLSRALILKLKEKMRVINPMTTNIKLMRSRLASEGEVWLQAYVESATNKLFRPQVAVLLEVAADAYGRLKGSVFTEDAVSRRYARYRKQYPKDFQKLKRCLKEFWSERLDGNNVELIPFLFERLAGPSIDIFRRCGKAKTLEEKIQLFSRLT